MRKDKLAIHDYSIGKQDKPLMTAITNCIGQKIKITLLPNCTFYANTTSGTPVGKMSCFSNSQEYQQQ